MREGHGGIEMVTNEKGIIQDNAGLQEFISRLDVDAVGIASLDEWKGTRLEETALKLLPTARSVVVMAMQIYREILTLVSPGRIMGAASMNDLYYCHSEYISGRLTRAAYDVAKASHQIGMEALPLPAAGCPLDARFIEAVFSYKHAGQAAGLGRLGWNSLLITPDFGSRVRLSCCLTEASLQSTATEITVQCENCRLCIDKCPAGALSNPQNGEAYTINKFACASYLNAAGGCAECIRLCPQGKGI